jgi:hypothetical protein
MALAKTASERRSFRTLKRSGPNCFGDYSDVDTQHKENGMMKRDVTGRRLSIDANNPDAKTFLNSWIGESAKAPHGDGQSEVRSTRKLSRQG